MPAYETELYIDLDPHGDLDGLECLVDYDFEVEPADPDVGYFDKTYNVTRAEIVRVMLGYLPLDREQYKQVTEAFR